MNATRDFVAHIDGHTYRGRKGEKVEAPKAVLDRLRKRGLVQVRRVKKEDSDVD